jgi:hypothetical protein
MRSSTAGPLAVLLALPALVLRPARPLEASTPSKLRLTLGLEESTRPGGGTNMPRRGTTGWSNGPMPAFSGEEEEGPGGEDARSAASRLLLLALLLLLLLVLLVEPTALKALLICMRS